MIYNLYYYIIPDDNRAAKSTHIRDRQGDRLQYFQSLCEIYGANWYI